MKVLILDHHFKQDIDALARVASDDDIVRLVPAEFFASRAREIFPRDVFDADLSRYHAPEFANQRAMYRKLAMHLTSELYLTFPFDVLVLPSDTFFYIRDVIDTVREMGIAIVVVQKESGVSAKSLEHHAMEMRRWFPFTGDVMTVCSEKSKDFWVACGARPEQVLILGQPRFDVYCSRTEAADLSVLGVDASAGRPTVLFLSYDLDAYAEERSLGAAHRPWERLHQETESVLLDLAAKGEFTLIIKPHPQQNASQLAHLVNRVNHVPNTFILPAGVDTRSLLLSVDTVVGFQTTAIAEAMIAGKRVLYTFWTENVERVQTLLLPFHEMGDAIEVATSRSDLYERLQSPVAALTEDVKLKRQRYCEPYLGIVDGAAATRVWSVVRANADRHISASATGGLDGRSLAYCRTEATRAARSSIVWGILAKGASFFPGARKLAARAEWRRWLEIERVTECRERIAGEYRRTGSLRGPRSDGVFGAARRLVAGLIQPRSDLDNVPARVHRARPC
ncbi:MAG: hypothetical protein V4529_09030 [Gemmatimonadota bacterium]